MAKNLLGGLQSKILLKVKEEEIKKEEENKMEGTTMMAKNLLSGLQSKLLLNVGQKKEEQ